MEKNIADKMLDALIDTDIIKDIEPELPLDEQLNIIKTYINKIPVHARKTIAQIVVTAGHLGLFKSAPEGVTINLARLPSNVIGEMYKQLVYYRQ